MKKVTIYILLIAFTGIQYACNKQLNALPDQSKVEGNIIIDQKSAEVALNGVYYRFAEGGDDRGTPSTQVAFTHEIIPTWSAGLLDYPYGGGALTENAVKASSYEATYIWVPCYLLVNAANGVIKGTVALPDAKITAQRRKEIIAEARFLRAYGHSRILNFYGQYYDMNSPYGALLRTEEVTSDNISKARSSVKDSYESIFADLDDAIANAPATRPVYYASSWAAKALKARLLLNRGLATDYTEILSLTNDILQNGPYELEAVTKNIFTTKGLDSKEVILGVTPMARQVNKSDNYFYYGPAYIPTPALITLLSGDPRENWVLGDVDGELGITKYKGPRLEENYLFRLTEIYLIRAEAIVRSGGPLADAKTLVKIVQQHSEVTNFSAVDNANTPAALLLEIYKEFARNMLCEDGQDWFALLRQPLTTVTALRPSITSKNQYILPIPQNEFLKNAAIGEQNPGYDK